MRTAQSRDSIAAHVIAMALQMPETTKVLARLHRTRANQQNGYAAKPTALCERAVVKLRLCRNGKADMKHLPYIIARHLDRFREAPTCPAGEFDWLVAGDPDEFPPVLDDLWFLAVTCRERRPEVILEFGVGWSTVVLAREAVPGELHTIDASQYWLDNTMNKMQPPRPNVTLHQSEVGCHSINRELVSVFQRLPDIEPDLIYIDAPTRDQVLGSVHGLTFDHRPPVSADLLLYESTLKPGAFVVIDGRDRTVDFLARALKRRWKIKRYPKAKRTTMELVG